jgi:hypothetical protein
MSRQGTSDSDENSSVKEKEKNARWELQGWETHGISKGFKAYESIEVAFGHIIESWYVKQVRCNKLRRQNLIIIQQD